MMGDELRPGAAPLFLALLPGSELLLEALAELVGVGDGVLVLEVEVAAMSPTPPLPAAVRGIRVGRLLSSSELNHPLVVFRVAADLRFQLYCFISG